MSQSGRRRSNVRTQYSAEDQALTAISKEAENRLAAKRAARAEAKEIRTKVIEKQQRETQSRQDRTGSRRGSDDSSEGGDGSSTSDRELKKELRALEEKYKAAMVSSAQLDNEKQSLVYQVELLKDQLEEQAEAHTELQREYKEKTRNLELTKRELQAAELELKSLREQNTIKDRLISESGLVIVAADNGDLSLQQNPDGPSSNGPAGTGAVLLSSEALDMLNKCAEGSLGTQRLAPSPHASHTTYPAPSASTNHTQQPGREEGEQDAARSSRLADGDSTSSGAQTANTSPSGSGSETSHTPGDSSHDDSQKALAEDNRESSVVSKDDVEQSGSVDQSKTDTTDGKSDVATDTVETSGSAEVGNENESQGNETDGGESAAVNTCTTMHGESEKGDDDRQNVSEECNTSFKTEVSEEHSSVQSNDLAVQPDMFGESECGEESTAERADRGETGAVPSVIVTECSHSQRTGSQESEDDVDEFFDAVSTPLPSPLDTDSRFEVVGSHMGESSTDAGLPDAGTSGERDESSGQEQGDGAEVKEQAAQSEGTSTATEEAGMGGDATGKDLNSEGNEGRADSSRDNAESVESVGAGVEDVSKLSPEGGERSEPEHPISQAESCDGGSETEKPVEAEIGEADHVAANEGGEVVEEEVGELQESVSSGDGEVNVEENIPPNTQESTADAVPELTENFVESGADACVGDGGSKLEGTGDTVLDVCGSQDEGREGLIETAESRESGAGVNVNEEGSESVSHVCENAELSDNAGVLGESLVVSAETEGKIDVSTSEVSEEQGSDGANVESVNTSLEKEAPAGAENDGRDTTDAEIEKRDTSVESETTDTAAENDEKDKAAQGDERDTAVESDDMKTGAESDSDTRDTASEKDDRKKVPEGDEKDTGAKSDDMETVAESDVGDTAAKKDDGDTVSEGEKKDTAAESDDRDTVSEGDEKDAAADGEKRDEVAESDNRDTPVENDETDTAVESEKKDTSAESEEQEKPGEVADEVNVQDAEDSKPATDEEKTGAGEKTVSGETEELSDTLSPLIGTRKPLDHDISEGTTSEDSEARLDEEYDFDDIDEVLDDSGQATGASGKDAGAGAAAKEADSQSEDTSSILSKDSGMQEISKNWSDPEPVREDDSAAEATHVTDTVSITSEDSGTGKDAGAEGGMTKEKAASTDSLDLEAKLDKLAAAPDSVGKDQSKQKHGSHKKSKKFKIFKNIFHK
ncbi:hypothetical protein BaRGS_00008039 [Batillaria attramentaria]|uniref:Uncharacterized protein n=1 Tax=Batillaria attramentaria TaxID=370345 RepID=A0ABD0LMQ7_9CAEN